MRKLPNLGIRRVLKFGDTLIMHRSPLMLANENCWKSLRSFLLALLRQKESLFPGRYSHDREAE